MAFVEQLAAKGYAIAMTARSTDAMEAIAAGVRQRHQVDVTVHPHDLSRPGGVRDLLDDLREKGVRPNVLINNAGFGLTGPFVDHDPERLAAMLQLNIVSLTELTLALGKQMYEATGGKILLVSSGTAYQPSPTMAGYGASKAYLLSLGIALNVELAPRVGVTVVSPGPMDTGFNAVSGFEMTQSLKRMTVPVDRVAKIGLEAMFAGRSSVIPGAMNQVGAFTSRLLSRHSAARMFAKMANSA